MKIVENEIIGELEYLEVEFDRVELVTGGMGVISQDAVKRYFIKKNPELKVKKCGGLKLDSQRDIVTMRFGVVNQSEKLAAALDSITTGVAPEHNEQKLLNPGYDELKRNYDEITKTLSFATEYNKVLQKDYDELKAEPEKHLFALQDKYDALVIAVGKDAQKFSDLLVENEELKVENSDLREALHGDDCGSKCSKEETDE